ncbi:extracellular solute-binding protein [Companilactobacillus nantensis]|nr:extracellular solute-binding protein [Companilactobacillus nantensis]GEO63169.1 hypothetical protein LNA01_03520 [Companilactobacillus nantensis]
MSNATISDIAKKAHVSIGTVSNVLNKKGNVKVDTIRRVEEAAKSLNYFRNEDALSIRQKDSTVVALVMPKLNDQTNPLYTNIYHELKRRNLSLKLYETNANEITEQACYQQINQQNYQAVLVINPLASEKTLQTWLNNSIQPTILSTSGSLQFNLTKITKKIDNKNIFVVKDELSLGFYKYFPNHPVIENSMRDIYRLLKDHNNFTIILFDDKLASRIENILNNMSDKEIKIILLTSKNIVSFKPTPKKDIFHYSANKTALDFVSSMATDKTHEINIYQTNYKLFTNESVHSSINILMLDTPFSEILAGLIDDFYSKYQIKVNIHTKNFNEMRTILSSNKLEDYDLIRLDISDFNWYGPDIFQSLKQFPSLETIIKKLSNWNKYINLNQIPYALPLDPSVQMMLYQKDIFDNSILQKQFIEKYNRSLQPPTNYAELADFSEFLGNLNIPEKNDFSPISLINNTGTLIASEFLPYYYSLGGQISYDDNVFEFDAETFIKTFELYKKVRQQSRITKTSWWDSETTDFNNQKTALIIGFTNHLTNINQTNYGIAPIPGNTPALGGGVIGISKNSHKTEAATLFLQWLYQYQIQHEIALMGGDVPANDLFFELEIYEQFPFLSYSTRLYSTGKRKTKLDANKPINTLLFEKIIGTQIYNGIENKLNPATVLLNLNNDLIKNRSKLMGGNYHHHSKS